MGLCGPAGARAWQPAYVFLQVPYDPTVLMTLCASSTSPQRCPSICVVLLSAQAHAQACAISHAQCSAPGRAACTECSSMHRSAMSGQPHVACHRAMAGGTLGLVPVYVPSHVHAPQHSMPPAAAVSRTVLLAGRAQRPPLMLDGINAERLGLTGYSSARQMPQLICAMTHSRPVHAREAALTHIKIPPVFPSCTVRSMCSQPPYTCTASVSRGRTISIAAGGRVLHAPRHATPRHASWRPSPSPSTARSTAEEGRTCRTAPTSWSHTPTP